MPRSHHPNFWTFSSEPVHETAQVSVQEFIYQYVVPEHSA